MNKNPIFIEYHSRENCDCYKIRNPWTKWGEEKIVLCPVSKGLIYAKTLANKVLLKKLKDALNKSLNLI